jgi:hypothetical protein
MFCMDQWGSKSGGGPLGLDPFESEPTDLAFNPQNSIFLDRSAPTYISQLERLVRECLDQVLFFKDPLAQVPDAAEDSSAAAAATATGGLLDLGGGVDVNHGTSTEYDDSASHISHHSDGSHQSAGLARGLTAAGGLTAGLVGGLTAGGLAGGFAGGLAGGLDEFMDVVAEQEKLAAEKLAAEKLAAEKFAAWQATNTTRYASALLAETAMAQGIIRTGKSPAHQDLHIDDSSLLGPEKSPLLRRMHTNPSAVSPEDWLKPVMLLTSHCGGRAPGCGLQECPSREPKLSS